MKQNREKKRIPASVIIEIILIIVVVLGFGYYFVHNYLNANNSMPEIVLPQGSNSFSVKATQEDLLSGVSAYDKEDGDVTQSMIIESVSPLFDGNKRTVTYVAFDESNNVTKQERDIEYTDYKSPVFTNEKHIFVPTGDYTEILSKLSATDVIDGDISNQIKLEINNVVRGVPGDYAVQVTVTNSCGDVTADNIVVTVTGEEER